MTESESLVMSAAIEAPIAFLMVWLARWPCRGAHHAAVASAIATAVTHPQLWAAVYWATPHFGYWQSVVSLEIMVIMAEGFLIVWMVILPLHRAMLISVVANVASALIGITLFD